MSCFRRKIRKVRERLKLNTLNLQYSWLLKTLTGLKHLMICIFLLSVTTLARSQVGTFQGIYFLNENKFATSGIQTFDGGFVFASAGSGVDIVKLRSDGIIAWQKNYPLGTWDKISQTRDSGYILCGSSSLGASLLRLDKYGDSVWYNTYGSSISARFFCVRENYDSGFIAVGYWWNKGYLVRTNIDGAVVWERLSTTVDCQFKDFVIYPNIDIVVAGDDFLNSNISLSRFDQSGANLVNHTGFNSEYIESSERIILSYDMKYIVSGYCRRIQVADNIKSHFTVIDTSGVLISQKYYSAIMLYPAKSSDNVNYVLAGYLPLQNHNYLFHFKKISSTGEIIWSRDLENAWRISVPYDLSLCSDGGYFSVGTFLDTNTKLQSAYIVKSNSECRAANPVGIPWKPETNIENETSKIFAYPNPFNGSLNVRIQVDKAGIHELSVFDISGKCISNIFNKFLNTGMHSIKINSDDRIVHSGVFFLSLRSKEIQKVVKILNIK